MEAQSLVSHQHSWWFSCFSLREKLARSHNKKENRFLRSPHKYRIIIYSKNSYHLLLEKLPLSRIERSLVL